jgi:hypothetical protein
LYQIHVHMSHDYCASLPAMQARLKLKDPCHGGLAAAAAAAAALAVPAARAAAPARSAVRTAASVGQVPGNGSYADDPETDAEYTMQQALVLSMTCANPAVDLFEDPSRVDSALSFMEAVQQELTEELTAKQGSIHGMYWLLAKASDEVLQTSGMLILLVAGPGGRNRSNEIVALQVDAAGFPIFQRAPSPTAAASSLLNRAVYNYKEILRVHAPSLQIRGRGSGNADGWVRLQLWLKYMYPVTSSSSQAGHVVAPPGGPAAAQHVALPQPVAGFGPHSLSIRRSRSRRSSSTAAGDSILAGNRQAAAANLPVNGSAAAPGGSNSNSSSDVGMQQLQMRETELVQMLSWSAPAQLQQELLPRLHAAMQQLKRLPAGSPARTQFDANWAYVQAWRGAESRHRTLQFLLALINDALDCTG